MDRGAVLQAHRAHVWPPYTSAEEHAAREPLVVARAEGVWLWDDRGRRVLDGNASWWSSALGHRHPRLAAALRDALGRVDHVAAGGATTEDTALLAAELVAVAPGARDAALPAEARLSRVHFSDDGSTAVEAAVKIAVQFFRQNGAPERTRLLALGGAYHGDTIGAVSLGAVDAFRRAYGPLLFEVVRPPDGGVEVAGWERAVDAIEQALAVDGGRIAAVVVEPVVQGAAGMRVWPPALLARLRAATRAAGALLVCDEVFTGYGRTGPMWACDHAAVVPDLLCVGKGFTGGLVPMAATLATARVWEGFSGGPERALMHGHTFCGWPLGAAVAREVLRVFRDEDVLGQVARRAPRVAAAMERLRAVPGVRRTRALGMIGAADLGDAGYGGRLGWRVYDEALARGVYLRPLGDTVYVTPSLTIGDAELDHLLAVLEESVRAVAR
jgi:adenosylmethionine-8-amino-7-oxononanoate aminotransferase